MLKYYNTDNIIDACLSTHLTSHTVIFKGEKFCEFWQFKKCYMRKNVGISDKKGRGGGGFCKSGLTRLM